MGKTVKASGRNVKESERNTTAIKLRLSPEAAEDLKAYAQEFGVSMSEMIEQLILHVDATTLNAIEETRKR